MKVEGSKLVLFFSSWSNPTLVEVFFSSSELRVRSALVRGRVVSSSESSMQWSKAVKALCIFALCARNRIPFEGKKGSYAAALDLCIAKCPRWLVDLFGENEKGICNARRLIKRKNPELKSGEICSMTLNEGLLSHESIEIHVGNEQLFESHQFDRLLNGLLCSSDTSEHNNTANRWRDFLASIYLRELQRSFQWRTPFSKNLLYSYLDSIRKNPSVQALFPINTKLGEGMLSELMSSHPDTGKHSIDWNWLIGEINSLGRPLKLAMSAPGCPLVITNYLKTLGFLIEADWEYTHAGYVADQVASKNIEGIDGFYAALTPSLTFVLRDRLKNFVPVCLLPQTNHQIVSNSKVNTVTTHRRKTKTMLLGKEITSAHLVHSELNARGKWTGTAECWAEDPDIVTYHLKEDPDPINAIMFFPFCDIVSALGNFSCQSADFAPSVSQPFILFLNRDLSNFERIKFALQLAFKHAWLELSSSPKPLTNAINSYLGIEGLPEYLARISGASALAGYIKYFGKDA